MADETLQQQPPTFSDELYKYAHDSGFIPKEATVDIFKKNLSNKDFVKELYDYSVQTEFIPKEATIDIFTKNIGGTNPAEKKNGTALPSTLAGGISNAMQGRTNSAIDAANNQVAPYSLSQVATERKKKVELNPVLKSVGAAAKDYKAATADLVGADFNLGVAKKQAEQLQGADFNLNPQVVPDLEIKQKAAKETADKAFNTIAANAPKGVDKQEYVNKIVPKLQLVQDVSELEDKLKENGQTLDDWSKYVDTEAPKEFLDDKQRALYDVVKTGDESKIKQAQELYFKDIDDEIKGIDSEITKISVSGTGGIGTGQSIGGAIADLKQKKQDLLDKKQGFLQPTAALKQVAEIDPNFGVVDDLLGKISPLQKVKMTLDKLYADKIKEQARLGTTSDYAQRRQAGTGFSQITPTGEIDTKEKLRKIDQAIKVLAPVAFLNQTPDMEQSNWTRFGRGVWNTLAGDATGTSLPKKEDIADQVTSLMASSGAVDNISSSGQKALKATVPELSDKAIDMASYITTIARSYGAIGGALQGAKIPQMTRLALSNVGKYSSLLGRITPALSRAVSEGITSELTGRALGGNAQQDLTFLSKFGAQGVTELLNNSPFGKLVSKAISGIGIKEVPKFVTTLAKINGAGTGSLIEEGVEEGISMYQASDSFDDFKKQLKQFVNSPSDLFLFVASSYALGGATSGFSPNVSNKFYEASDKAYNNLPPDEKTAFDNVVNDVKQGQEDAVMEVVLKTVDKVPNKVVDGLVIELKQGVDKLVNTIVGEDGYEVKIGDTVYQGNTIQDLQNDIDDAQGLLAIYKGEQDNRIQNGITIEETETPPIAEADQTDVEQPQPEAGVGVEGEVEKPTPSKINVLGQEVNNYNNYIPTKAGDVEPDAIYTFNANSKDGIPTLLHDKAYANKSEVNGVKTENWHASISGDDLLKLFPTTQTTPSPINAANAPETAQNAQENGLIKETGENLNQDNTLVKPNDKINKKVFIHETNADNIDKFDISKSGTGQGGAWLGRGVYLQEGGTFKLEKYGKNKVEVSLKPSSNIFEVEETPDGEFRDSFVEWAVKNTDAGKRKYEERLKDGLDAKGILPRDILKRNPEVVDKLKEAGYDGLYQDGELVVYNPDVLKINKTEQPTKNQPQEVEVKETVSEKQGGETIKQIYTDTNEVGTTQYYTVNDNGNVESSIEVSPVGSDIVIDNAKVSSTEKRKGLASSLVDKIIQDYKGKTNTYIDENGNEITEPYQIKLGTVVSNEGTGFAKSIQKKIDDFNAEQQQITKAPKGQVKAEPSVKAETTPTEKVDEKRESPKATETDLGKKQGAPKKQAIPTESIDNLVKGGTKRKAALENITEPKIADVAKALTDTKGLAKIMDILNGDDIQALNDLENSIGFKKIC